ncbi:uncharacterized protein [Macrobrachium rosenbergii]|uniref:uncharacterized protein isoform X2 n=1 Tax=Macrobrachium rosenbergii TaxID=79674 RepID=UPI0034D65C55
MVPKLSFFVALTFISLAAAGPTDTETAANYECPSPYQPVGPDNYCLLIDNRISGTWDDMRKFCKEWNGDLAYFHDANLLYEVVHYIHQHVVHQNRKSEETPVEAVEEETAASECPVPFQMISDACLLISVVKTNTWFDSKTLCEALGGHLAKVDDANLMGDLYDYLTNKSVRTPLWIGDVTTVTRTCHLPLNPNSSSHCPRRCPHSFMARWRHYSHEAQPPSS